MEKTSLWRLAVPLALIAVPLLLAAAKLWHGPHWLALGTSLEPLPAHTRHHVEYLLFIPLSTAVVAFFRLTLGVQVLSIFRPALIAIAFQRTGIPLGLLFLALALGCVVGLQPAVKGHHYYARVPVTAAVVVSLMIAAVFGFEHWQASWMLHVAYFPAIALCLTCESFASTLEKSGAAVALWRAVTTAAIGAMVLWVVRIPGFMALLLRCPELLLAQAGGVLLIAQRFDYRLLEGWNPFRAAPRENPRLEFAVPVQIVETNL